MAGPGGAEVGRVHIKVVPDFTHFRKIMNAVLKEYSARTIDVKVKADSSALDGLSKDLSNTAKKSSKAMSAELSKGLKAAGKDAKVTPVLDSKARFKKRMQADLNKVFDQIEVRLQLKGGSNADLRDYWDKELAQVQKQIGKLDVELDTRSFNAQAAYVQATLNKLRADSQKLREPSMQVAGGAGTADLDIIKIRNDTIALNNEIHKSAGVLRNLDAAFDNAFNSQKRQAIREYLYGFRDMNAEIVNAGRKANGSVALFGLEDSISRVSGKVDSLRMRGGLIGGLLGGAGAIAGAKGMLELTAKGIANVGQAAAKGGEAVSGFGSKLGNAFNPRNIGLSVSGGGIVAILGAITLVAAPLIGLLTTAALTLPGLLATIMAPIAAITLGFGGIKKAAENAGLFGDANGSKKGGGSLGAALKDLQKNVEDVFEKGLTEPFKKLGAVANTWVAPLTTVAQGTVDVFKGMLDSITSELGSQRIADTFSGVGNALSKGFAPGLKSFGDAIVGLAAEFTKPGGALEGVSQWFKDTMGDFSRWIEEGIKTGSLTESFKQLGETIKIVLDGIGDLAQSGMDFIKDPAAMDGFKNTLKDIVGLIERLGDISAQLGPVWDLLDKFLPNKREYDAQMDGMIQDFEKLKGMKPGTIDNMAAAEKNRPWWKFWDPGTITPEATKAGDTAAQAYMASVTAAVRNNKEAQAELLKQAFTPKGVTEAVAGQITAQAGVAITGVQQALTPLKEGLQTDINNALLPLGDIAGRVGKAFDGVPALVQTSLAGVAGVVVSSLMNIGTLVPGALFNLPMIIGNAFNPAVEAVRTTLGRMGQVAVEASLAVVQAIGQAFAATAPAVEGGMAPAIASVGSICQQMVSVALSFAGAMRSAGTAIGASFAQGLADSSGLVANSASALLGVARAFFPNSPAKKGPFSGSGWIDKSGEAIGKDFAGGITNSQSGVVSSARELMQAIKDVFGSAEGLNINFYMGQAASSMSAMADSSKEFRTNMVAAGTTPAASSGLDSSVDLDDIKRQKAAIDLRIAELQAAKNGTADKAAKAALTSEIDQLRIQKERLDLLKEENGLQEERKTAIQKLSDQIATNITDMIKMPGEFAKTTANAAMQDLGISGSGALPTIANWALDAGTNFVFNVNNMDDAIQGQQAQQRAQTAGVTGTR